MVEDFLRGLKFSNARPARTTSAANDPVSHARERLVASIQEHKKLVEADIDGKELNLTITKRNKDGETVTVPKRVLRWYFEGQDGNWHTVIRYGTRALEFEGGDAIQVGPQLADIIKIYDRIIKAVEAGKLDQHIAIAKERAPRGSKQGAEGEEDTQDEEREFEPPPPPARAAAAAQVQPNFRKRARA